MTEKRPSLAMSRSTLSTLSSNRYHRSKGLRVKHVLQFLLLVFVVTWIFFQLTHSDLNTPAPAAENVGSRRNVLLEDGVSLLGRKGGNLVFGAERGEQMEIGEKDDDEEGGHEDNKSGQMDGLAFGKDEESEEIDRGRRNLNDDDDDDDNDDEDEVVEDSNRGIEDDITTANDSSIEDFFNEDAENALPEVEDEQLDTDEANGDDDAPLEELTDFEGEESLKDRKAEESDETKDTRMLAVLREGKQNFSFSEGAVNLVNKTRKDNGTAISEAGDRARGLKNDVKTAIMSSGETLQLDLSRINGTSPGTPSEGEEDDSQKWRSLASVKRQVDSDERPVTVYALLGKSSNIDVAAGKNM